MAKSIAKPRVITVDDYYSERFLRIEEELRHQRELMKLGFDTIGTRIEDLRSDMNTRFEDIRSDMNTRFEAMDKRFVDIRTDMNTRFEAVDKRFESIDKRFESVDKRFESVDKRFDLLTRRMDRFMIWSFGITLTCTGLIIAAMKYLR